MYLNLQHVCLIYFSNEFSNVTYTINNFNLINMTFTITI